MIDEVLTGSSYASQSDTRVHFGLGSATKVDSVEVRWPSGLVESYDDLPLDTIDTLKEGSGTAIKPESGKPLASAH